MTLTCPGDEAGYFAYSCSSGGQQPGCAVWDGDAYVISSSCVVLDYTAYNTTCLCAVDGSGTARRRGRRSLAAADNQKVLDIAGAVNVIPEAIDIGWQGVSEEFTNAASDQNTVLIGVWPAFLGLLVVGVLVILYYQYRQSKLASSRIGSGGRSATSLSPLFALVLPVELGPASLIHRLRRKLYDEHVFLSLFTPEHLVFKWIHVFGVALNTLFV